MTGPGAFPAQLHWFPVKSWTVMCSNKTQNQAISERSFEPIDHARSVRQKRSNLFTIALVRVACTSANFAVDKDHNVFALLPRENAPMHRRRDANQVPSISQS